MSLRQRDANRKAARSPDHTTKVISTPDRLIARWRSMQGQELIAGLLRGEPRACRALSKLDDLPWVKSWIRWVIQRNRSVRTASVRHQNAMAKNLAEELDIFRERQSKLRSALPTDQRRFRGNLSHL